MTAYDQGAVHVPGVGPASPGQKVEDLVIGLSGFQPGAAEAAPNGRLVRIAAEHIHRMTMVLVETDGIGYQRPAPALFALIVVANTRSGLAALAVLLGVEGNRAFVVLARVVSAAGRFLQAPDGFSSCLTRYRGTRIR